MGSDEYKKNPPLSDDTVCHHVGWFTDTLHTPTLHGKGFTRELVKLADPSLVRSIGHGLQAYEKGASPAEALKSSSHVLKRGLKRKVPAAAALYAKTKTKQSYKKKRQRVKDILGV